MRVFEEARQELGPDFRDVRLGGRRKQTNPQSGVAFDLEGQDIYGVNLNLFREPARSMRSAPRIDDQDVAGNPDAENAAEMIELYWMALMRDVYFTDYRAGGAPPNPPTGWPVGNLATQAAADLNVVKNAFKERYPRTGSTVRPQNIFRGSAPGDNEGPYVSQFLLRGSTVFDGSIMPPTVIRRPEAGFVTHGTQSFMDVWKHTTPFVISLLLSK